MTVALRQQLSVSLKIMRVLIVASACLIGCGGSQVPQVESAPKANTGSAQARQAPQPRSSAELAAVTLPHVVSIEGEDGQGSGFFITEDLVVTCFHVVRGSETIKLKGRAWRGSAVAVAAWDEDNDLAIVRVAPKRSGMGAPLSKRVADVGTRVVVVSSPLGLENSVSDGLLSAVRAQPRPLLQFTAPISPGSSGGPVVDESGKVVGVVSSTLTATQRGTTYGQNLNFAVPAARIFEIVKAAKDTPLPTFAQVSIPAEERRWQTIEGKLPEIEATLQKELGETVAQAYASDLRRSIAARDADLLRALISRRTELREKRKEILDWADFLVSTGPRGSTVARSLVAAWESFAANSSPSARARFDAMQESAREYLRELDRETNRPEFPAAFAGFRFLGSVRPIHEWCFPGYTTSPVGGLTELDCPAAAVPPPFIRGPVSLTFLNGRLVAVQAAASSYNEAVETISGRYGTPTYSRMQKNAWYGAQEPSFATNTAFDWKLRGGRIRVGRLNGTPFVVFIRDERDEAITNSF